MSNYAIQVESLGKEYIIGSAEQRHDSFREMLTSSLKSPIRRLRKLGGTASVEERFWALKDVSFNVEQGEVLGIIGRNGAGKSTLLKVLSRITSPTTGRVLTRGRVASLLEVGTGFHPELTGRENIYLNGAILGMTQKEVSQKFDQITAFAGLEKFVDTPVKRYSSGMYVRLAFSVAAHLEPEVLLIDEVLAVGDSEFQNKCLGKLNEVARDGRTVIFVSHNLSMVQSLCNSAIVMDRGLLVANGDVQPLVSEYLALLGQDAGINFKDRRGNLGNQWIRLKGVALKLEGQESNVLQTGKAVEFHITYELNKSLESAGFRIEVKSELGEPVMVLSNDFCGSLLKVCLNDGVAICSIDRLPLMPGRYIVTIACGAKGELSDVVVDAQKFDVVEGDFYGGGRLPAKGSGRVLVPHQWSHRLSVRE